MTLDEVMNALAQAGNEQTKKIYAKHGATGDFYGVKVQDLKQILKHNKKNHNLALQLYNTGNADAMYLAGLMADSSKITKEVLADWIERASWYMISEYAVPWTAADSPFGFEMGMQWIDSHTDHVAAGGWATLASWLSVTPPEEIDTDAYAQLLNRIEKDIQNAPNRTRYAMNNFVISVGGYLEKLTEAAKTTAKNIGKIHVNLGDTACKVPDALSYIDKMTNRNLYHKRRKTARC